MAESLRALQQAFWALITAPTGVPDAIAQRPRHAWLVGAVRGGRASPVDRLDVYANMYFYRLLENLGADFPALAAQLGEVAFHNLITDYLIACPSRAPSARDVGCQMATFLREHLADAPWLSDLAALEWARIDVHDRADQQLLTRADLQQAARGGFEGLRLVLVAAHTQLRVAYAIEPCWRAASTAEVQPQPDLYTHDVLVWRGPDCRVHHRALASDEASLMPLLRSGVLFSELCARLMLELDAEAAARRALSLLAEWTDTGLLVRDRDEAEAASIDPA